MNIYIILAIVAAAGMIVCAIFARTEKGIIFAVGTISCIIIAITLVGVGIILPLSAKANIATYKALQFTVDISAPIVGYEKYESAIVEANEWLDKARKDLNTFGIFSKYYNTEIDDLDYILME